MSESFITVGKEYQTEFVEKRSKFIATINTCKNVEEAEFFIKKIKSLYWDAKHNVYAYSVDEGKIKRFSDDGEPHGTAGKPILEIIEGSKLKNVVIIVTRYFGGILLGTGGLVRAYSKAAKDAAFYSEKAEMYLCCFYTVKCEYKDNKSINNVILLNGGIITDTIFTEQIEIKFYIKEEYSEKLLQNIAQIFKGKITPLEIEQKMTLIK